MFPQWSEETFPLEVHTTAQNTLSNALKKAQSVQSAFSSDTLVIGADTLVTLEDRIFNKPRNKEDAKQMLQQLSGRTHEVVTGVAIISTNLGEFTQNCLSQVQFKKMDDKEIESYCSTQEPYDKAGAYAVQGLGSLFIERIEGSYTNVMGLPIETLLTLLAQATRTRVYEWF